MKLPFKLRCDDFPDVHKNDSNSFYHGSYHSKSFTILLKNKIEGRSPVLYTFNKNNQQIDSLVVFSAPCNYVNRLENYEPWLEITKDYSIIISDTTFFEVNKYDSTRIAKGLPAYYYETDFTVERKVFLIEKSGKIKAKN